MNARHRFPIVPAAVAAVTLNLMGGRADAQEEPIPNTALGRAAQACIDSGDWDFDDFVFYDDGLSIFVLTLDQECILEALGLPEWVDHTLFAGVLKFGDWSVMRGAVEVVDSNVGPVLGAGDLLILANGVAPE